MERQIYNNAVNAIRESAQNKLFELEQEFTKNRIAHVNKFMEELFDGVDKDSPVYSIATLVAQTTTIGREDGYPSYNVCPKTLNVLKAAKQAGLFNSIGDSYIRIGQIAFYNDISGIAIPSSARNQDYESWNKLTEYKQKQTWMKL